MISWFKSLSDAKKTEMMKKARSGGKKLREVNLQKEREVLAEIHSNLQNELQPSGKRKSSANHGQQQRSRRRTESTLCEDTLKDKLAKKEDILVSTYIAVAYEDAWYPGVVQVVDSESDNFDVTFLHGTRTTGVYNWPSREDKQKVNVEYILKCGFVPEAINSGRLWKISEHEEIQSLYQQFKQIYFSNSD